MFKEFVLPANPISFGLSSYPQDKELIKIMDYFLRGTAFCYNSVYACGCDDIIGYKVPVILFNLQQGLELFLKGLSRITLGRYKRTHDLTELLNSISSKLQEAINIDETIDNNSLTFLTNSINEINNLKTNIEKERLGGYFYEKKENSNEIINMDNKLINLINVCNNTMIDIKIFYSFYLYFIKIQFRESNFTKTIILNESNIKKNYEAYNNIIELLNTYKQ